MKATASAWILGGLLGVAGLLTALPLAIEGPAMFAWDDTEYVTQALETFEHVNARGLISWPAYMAHHQVVKPPLYVNTLAAALFVVGRDRGALAAGMVGGASIVCFGLAVYWLVSRLAQRHIALAATAAMLALPCVARWFPAAYTDGQLSVLTLLAIGLLAVDVDRWRLGRTVLLGVTIGLAMLAKTTFPMFLVLPLGYWLVRGGEGRPPLGHRVGVAAQVVAIAAIVASTWYVTQGKEALYYARVSSGFQLGPVADNVWGRAQEWLAFLLARGWGYSLALLAVVGIAARVSNHGASSAADGVERRRAAGRAVVMLLLGALPMLVFAAWSRVPPNTRHPLPSLILVAVAVLIAALNQVDRSRYRSILWPACLLVVGIQGAAAAASLVPPVARTIRDRPIGAWAVRLAPGLNEHRPVSLEAASIVLDRAREVTSRPGSPTDWYVSGNSAYLNVPRLRMLAKLRGVPVNFLWGSYFAWSRADRDAKAADMRKGPCVVVLYEPVAPAGTELAELNQHNAETRAFVADPANGFELVRDASVTTEVYALTFYVRPRPPGQP